MSVTPEELLTASEGILNQAETEAELRAAVSRIYYSAFHKCRICAQLPEEIHGTEGGIHKQVIRDYVYDDDSVRKGVGYILNTLRARRVEADYHLEKEISKETADFDLKQARRIFDALTPALP